MPDDMMDIFDRWIGRIVNVLAIIVLGLMLGYAWRLFQEPVPHYDPPDRPSFKSEADRQEHFRLLRKHGLEHQVAIIYEDHLGRYFIRGNQRCAFK